MFVKRELLVIFGLLAAMGCGRPSKPATTRTAPSTPSAALAGSPQAQPDSAVTGAAEPSAPQATSASSAPAGAVSAAPEPADQTRPAPNASVIPAGAEVRVRLDQALDTKHARAGDGFNATLASPITVQGRVVAPRGTPFHGRILEARESGRLKGRAVMELGLDSFELDGVWYPIKTRPDVRTSSSHKKRNLAFIGGGSGGGAAIGGIAAGGPGALIGAGAGAAAGVTTALATGRKEVNLPAETPLWFALKDRVTIPM